MLPGFEKIDARNLGYRYDPELDIPWSEEGAPGLFFTPAPQWYMYPSSGSPRAKLRNSASPASCANRSNTELVVTGTEPTTNRDRL